MIEPRGPVAPHTEAVRPAIEHVRFHLHTCLPHRFNILIELTIERGFCTIGIESRRNIACTQVVHVIVRYAQSFVERMNAPPGQTMTAPFTS